MIVVGMGEKPSVNAGIAVFFQKIDELLIVAERAAVEYNGFRRCFYDYAEHL